jgi:Fic family protein
MMLDVTQHYDEPLTAQRLFDRQAALFSTGRSGMSRINVGAWRDDKNGAMQVVSGPIGKERVHYEAPVAARLRAEMKKFLDWFEKSARAQGGRGPSVVRDHSPLRRWQWTHCTCHG